MIRVLAAPTELILSDGSYARTYRLLRESGATDVEITAEVNECRVPRESFPPNVTVDALDRPNRMAYFASSYPRIYRRLRSGDVDVYQHANLGFREFNPAVLLPPSIDVPFLIGPAEAGHAVPSAEFERVVSRQVERDLPDWLTGTVARAAEPLVRNGLNPVRERLFGATLERADRVIAVHSDAKAKFEQYTDGSKIEVVPYGVDMEKFPYSAGETTESFVTVGNLIERKGHEYLLMAFDSVLERYPSAHLHIVGSGPRRERLERIASGLDIEESVTFHGFVDHDLLLELLHRARAFVHPSISEGFSHVRLEAMSTGCPVIGTAVDGAHDLTRDSKDGIIVPTASPDALADAMSDLLSDPDLTSKMGSNARRKVERDHDYDDISQQYLDIYRELAE